MEYETIREELKQFEQKQPCPNSVIDQYEWWVEVIAQIKHDIFQEIWDMIGDMIWDMEFDGLDTKIHKILENFWAEMKKLKEKHMQ